MARRMGGMISGILIAGCAALAGPAAAETLLPVDPEVRCMALIAYAEAAGEGRAGMAAVIRVVQNRISDPRFPDDACAVAVQPGQFQPVGERPRLRDALLAPERANLVQALGGPDRVSADALRVAIRLALRGAPLSDLLDSTGGALYFVNPDLMDPGKCPWFASLKRTASIGAHVFMTHYGPDETSQGPALDCSKAGQGRRATVAASEPEPSRYKIPPRSAGPKFDPVVWLIDNRRDTRIDNRVTGRVSPR